MFHSPLKKIYILDPQTCILAPALAFEKFKFVEDASLLKRWTNLKKIFEKVSLINTENGWDEDQYKTVILRTGFCQYKPVLAFYIYAEDEVLKKIFRAYVKIGIRVGTWHKPIPLMPDLNLPLFNPKLTFTPFPFKSPWEIGG